MDHLLIVCILQGLGNLCDVGDDGVKRELRTFGMVQAQAAAWSIFHDQEGSLAFHTKVQDLDDMGMPQRGNGACLGKKAFNFIPCQLPMEHFNCSLGIQINMLPQVDVSKAPLS